MPTYTFYPDAGTGNTTVDGNVKRYDSGGDTWANMRDGAGTGEGDTTTTSAFAFIASGTTTDEWTQIARSIFLFDTSTIVDTEDISSATFSLRENGSSDGLSISPTFNVYSSNPASNNILVAADYGTLGSTALSSDLAYADISSLAFNDFSLNATGIAAVSKTGITKLGVRMANYDVADTEPTWSSGVLSQFRGYFADITGTTSDPKLVVVTGGDEVALNTIIII